MQVRAEVKVCGCFPRCNIINPLYELQTVTVILFQEITCVRESLALAEAAT